MTSMLIEHYSSKAPLRIHCKIFIVHADCFYENFKEPIRQIRISNKYLLAYVRVYSTPVSLDHSMLKEVILAGKLIPAKFLAKTNS